ncbi:hypothetical protein [Flavobacterium sp.]|uniref:hypothetical protein n=1 Tax=Flavobacterium sp. TaxID=239 RepID=UPI0039E5AD99
MKTIEEVQQFISDYADALYLAKIGLHDHDITYEQHKQNIAHLQTFYAPFQRYGQTTHFLERFTDMDSREESEKKLKKILKKKIFLIRKYEGAMFAKGITADNDIIFCCFLDSDHVLIDDTIYHTNVAVGFCNGELCILSKRLLDSDMLHQHNQLVWTYHSNSREVEDDIWIKDNGKWVETLRINEPEIPLWITDYHREY